MPALWVRVRLRSVVSLRETARHTHAGGEIHQYAAYAETAIWEAGKASGKGGQETVAAIQGMPEDHYNRQRT